MKQSSPGSTLKIIREMDIIIYILQEVKDIHDTYHLIVQRPSVKRLRNLKSSLSDGQ